MLVPFYSEPINCSVLIKGFIAIGYLYLDLFRIYYESRYVKLEKYA